MGASLLALAKSTYNLAQKFLIFSTQACFCVENGILLTIYLFFSVPVSCYRYSTILDQGGTSVHCVEFYDAGDGNFLQHVCVYAHFFFSLR